MFLRSISISAFPLSPMKGDTHSHRSPFLFSTALSSSSSNSFLNYAFSSTISMRFRQRRSDKLLVVSASNKIVGTPLTGVLFEPFEELKKDAFVVPVSPRVSLARQGYSKESEAAINEQIKCVIFSFLFFLIVVLLIKH
jgi:ferritin heavy chain